MSERISWIDATGTEHRLDDLLDSPNGNYLTGVGDKGLGMPQTRMIEQDIPLRHGTVLRYTLALPVEVDLPILVKAASESSWRQAVRQLRTWLNPYVTGNGKLRHYAADMTVRELTCKYVSGLEEDASAGHRGAGWLNATLVLRAADPFWYDQFATVLSFGVGGAVNYLDTPVLPRKLSPSGIASRFVVANGGDVEAWPVWTIQGPGVNPVLTNVTTGEVITLTITLGSSDSLTIDTTPGVKTITLQNGTNEFGTLALGSTLWSLGQGNTTATLAMTGTGASSAVVLSYKQRWVGV